MSNAERYLPLVGRILLATIFVSSGLNKIGNWDSTAGYMASKGMPLVPVFLIGAIVLQVVGGLSVMFGFRARIGAALLLLFLAPATFIFHNPVGLEGMAQQMEIVQLMKNFSIAGGVLLFLAHGAGPISLDARRRG